MAAGLEEQHLSAALGKLTGDDAAAGAEPITTTSSALRSRVNPEVGPVFLDPHGQRRVEIDLLVGARALGARGQEVAVEGLDGQRPDELEGGRRGVRSQSLGSARRRFPELIDRVDERVAWGTGISAMIASM